MGLPLFFYVFIVDLLQQIVISLMVSFFVSFRNDNLDDKVRSNRVIK